MKRDIGLFVENLTLGLIVSIFQATAIKPEGLTVIISKLVGLKVKERLCLRTIFFKYRLWQVLLTYLAYLLNTDLIDLL